MMRRFPAVAVVLLAPAGRSPGRCRSRARFDARGAADEEEPRFLITRGESRTASKGRATRSESIPQLPELLVNAGNHDSSASRAHNETELLTKLISAFKQRLDLAQVTPKRLVSDHWFPSVLKFKKFRDCFYP